MQTDKVVLKLIRKVLSLKDEGGSRAGTDTTVAEASLISTINASRGMNTKLIESNKSPQYLLSQT